VKRRFSERIGLVEPRQVLQKDSIDERLWARLWSLMDRCFWSQFDYFVDESAFAEFIIDEIQDDFLGKPSDEVPSSF
jgi:hypothetical protein